jgi:hypothetical protein
MVITPDPAVLLRYVSAAVNAAARMRLRVKCYSSFLPGIPPFHMTFHDHPQRAPQLSAAPSPVCVFMISSIDSYSGTIVGPQNHIKQAHQTS